jgi:Protein of unknown function (DUF4230)
MIKSFISKYLLLLVLILGVILGGYYMIKNQFFKSQQAENTTIILDKIKTVTKLISVEGQFSELYSYKESYEYDFFNLFSKKIILRVNAKVSVGYDFENVNLSIDSLTKTVTLNELPSPEILSIDHNLDYYDISEGTFNSFTPEELTNINKKAKDFIASKAKTTQILQKAEAQKQDYLKMMEMALKSGGWKFVIKSKAPLN